MDESPKPLSRGKKRGAPYGNTRGLGNVGGARKSSYTPKLAAVARKCCERGLTDLEIADILEVSPATLYRWKLQYPNFAKVFELGKAAADARVERSLYSRAIGYDYITEKAVMTRHGQKTMRYRQHIPPDTAAAVWYLKNRRPDRWRDVHRHEHVTSPYDDIENAAELRELLTKQAVELGLIPPPIIDVTPKAPSLPQEESTSEVLQTPLEGKRSSST
jgi:transposase-like protein